MPMTNPAFPRGPYRFTNREYFIIQYRTDPEALRRVVPEPLELTEPVVNYEFIRMPDSTGFGDYTESGQVIPVSYQGQTGSFTHQMFLNDHPPIAGGRELWGFPKKLAQPKLAVETDTLVGTLNYGSVRIATGTMGYKHCALDIEAEARKLAAPNFLLKVIPHVDGTARICELVRFHLEDITVKGAWTGPRPLISTRTPWLPSPSCRSFKCCRPSTSLPTSPLGSARWSTTTFPRARPREDARPPPRS